MTIYIRSQCCAFGVFYILNAYSFKLKKISDQRPTGLYDGVGVMSGELVPHTRKFGTVESDAILDTSIGRLDLLIMSLGMRFGIIPIG